MSILGIENRTENWMTVQHLAPLFSTGGVELARRLLPESERGSLRAGEVRTELFWYGMRDFFSMEPREYSATSLVLKYEDLFPLLHTRVEAFVERDVFSPLKEHNYKPRLDTDTFKSNLINTEIDIAIETPGYLFIGEAKHLSTLGANGRHVLVHQLIRQFVMARMLVRVMGSSHTVVPFVVAGSRSDVENSGQVQFMLAQEWMREENVLTWREIEEMA